MTPRTRGLTKATRPTTIVGGPLLDSDAVAKALGITRRHVQRLVSERRIPYLKVGRFVRFDPGELNVWLDAQRIAPERPAPGASSSWR